MNTSLALTSVASWLSLAGDGQWLDNPVITEGIPVALMETLGMTFFSGLFTAIGGLPLGLWLHNVGPVGLAPNRPLYRVLSAVVNVGRSIPFLILAVFIIPFTRFLVGSFIGWHAAVVPLAIGAIPFYARIVENAVREVEPGKVEAAQMVGASRMQIVTGVQIREALPGLVSGFTVTVIALISYSAMAGAIGGGGLGKMAISYGFQRQLPDVMTATIILIILIVQGVQWIGDAIVHRIDHRH
jgi:D-methionine transport system permease protein